MVRAFAGMTCSFAVTANVGFRSVEFVVGRAALGRGRPLAV